MVMYKIDRRGGGGGGSKNRSLGQTLPVPSELGDSVGNSMIQKDL